MKRNMNKDTNICRFNFIFILYIIACNEIVNALKKETN